jgi:GLPGLI family protein
MKNFTLIAFLAISIPVLAQPAKILSEFSVVYELSVQDAKGDTELKKSMDGATKTIYIKGTRVRSDLNSSNYTQTTFSDSKTDSTVVLRELGKAKYMSYLSKQKRDEQNKKFEGIVFNKTGETKTILGYECTKVVAKLKDGSTYNVYFAASIAPSNNEYEYQFRDLPGLVLEYETESEDGKTKIRYTATKISITPVPVSKFDLPKSGYRIL